MARTPTVNISLQYVAPDFYLTDTVSGKKIGFKDIKGEKGTLVMFICNHCPFVVHVRDELVKLANDYIKQGIGFVAISSNDTEKYPDDAPDKMKELAIALKFPFPYLFDETQEVAKYYTAACTPDFSIFNSVDKCIYRGQLDDSRPGNNIPVTGKDIRNVLNALISGNPISTNQLPSIGCNIKWKPGNEPEYYKV
jgi:peroxiredoxin